jgi:hypothetical protein
LFSAFARDAHASKNVFAFDFREFSSALKHPVVQAAVAGARLRQAYVRCALVLRRGWCGKSDSLNTGHSCLKELPMNIVGNAQH